MGRTTKGIVVLASAALALALSACGGDKPKTAETPKTNPADIKAELTWWDTSDPKNEGPAFKELITKFNQTYPNVKINYQSVPFGDAQNKFKTAAQAKIGRAGHPAGRGRLGARVRLPGLPLRPGRLGPARRRG